MSRWLGILGAMKTTAIIVAAGDSRRFGTDLPKQFQTVHGRPLLSWTISRFEAATKVDEIVLVVSDEYTAYASENVVDPYEFRKVNLIVSGGASRSESVLNGLKALSESVLLAAIHDGVRSLVSPEDIDAVITKAEGTGAAILATPVSDTVKQVKGDLITATLDRRKLYLAQTPQVFGRADILAAHEKAASSQPDHELTDDAMVAELAGIKISIVAPTAPNPKVTVEDDLRIVEALLKEEAYG